MQPGRALRDTGISAIILMDSQIDHTTGLLSLREGCPHQVWCTDMVHEDLSTGFPLFTMLTHWNGGLSWNRIELDRSFSIPSSPNLRFTPLPLRSAAPPYSPHRFDPHPGDNIGLIVEDLNTGGKLFYAPGLGKVDAPLLEIMASSDCVLVDGTMWDDDEMQRRGVGTRTGREMGHLAQNGPGACSKCWNSCLISARCLSTSTTPTRFSMKIRRSVRSWFGARLKWPMTA